MTVDDTRKLLATLKIFEERLEALRYARDRAAKNAERDRCHVLTDRIWTYEDIIKATNAELKFRLGD